MEPITQIMIPAISWPALLVVVTKIVLKNIFKLIIFAAMAQSLSRPKSVTFMADWIPSVMVRPLAKLKML